MAKHRRSVEQVRASAGPRAGGGGAPGTAPGRTLGSIVLEGLRKRPEAALGLLLFLVTVGVFLPSVHNGFINYDDSLYLHPKIPVQDGLTGGNVQWAFTNVDAGFWQPLTWLSVLLDCQLFGLWAGGHHLTSVLLHAANTALLFLLFRRMTGAIWRSAFVAALFAVHPLHVETVAWVADRKDVLCTLFWLLAMLMYALYAEGRMQNAECRMQNGKDRQDRPASPARPPNRPLVRSPACSLTRYPTPRYLLSLVFFACGLMSKTMVVTLPFILMLLDWWPLRRVASPPRGGPRTIIWRDKLPFVALAFCAGLATVYGQGRAGALSTTAELPVFLRVCNAVVALAQYLAQMVWPARLAVFYPYPKGFSVWSVGVAVMILMTISVLAVCFARRKPYLAFGWVWYLITLLPVLQLIQVGGNSHADRFTYLPLIGVFALLAWGANDLTRHWRQQRLICSLAAALALGLCLGFTREQIGYWADSETLFRHALAVTQDNYLAHQCLGSALTGQGRVQEALPEFEQAIRLRPDYADAHNNLGALLARSGRLDEALPHFQEALRLRPDYAEAHCNLGDALTFKAQFDDAIGHYREAIRLQPNQAGTHSNLGKALGITGRLEEASAEFRAALVLDPHQADAHCNLGIALIQTEHFSEAISHLEAALKITPDSAEAHCHLGVALGRQGRLDEAVLHLQQAVRLAPEYADARNNLRIALDLQKSAATAPSPAAERQKP